MSRPARTTAFLAVALVFALAAPLATSPVGASRLSALASERGYEVVPWATQSVRVLDSRVAWLPSIQYFPGPSLLLANDPYAAAPAAVTEIASPAPFGGVPLYDYASGRTRNLTFPSSIGGFSYPGAVTPFTHDGRAYLLSLATSGSGVTVGMPYPGGDLEIAAAGILDVPAFAHFLPVNLSVPASALGFALNQSILVAVGLVPDGVNLTAVAEVSAVAPSGYTNPAPPWAKYVYTVDLATAAWTDGQPLVLSPRVTLPWSNPVSPGFLDLLTPSQLLVITSSGGPSTPANVHFVNLGNGSWTNTSLPGRNVVWHGTVGSDLYLLQDNWQNGTYDEYVLERIDRDVSGAATGASVVWDKVFPRPVSQLGLVPVVTGQRVDFFQGIYGYLGYASPALTNLTTVDLLSGTVLSDTDENLTMPLLNGNLASLAYPSLGLLSLFNGFVADPGYGVVYPLDLVAIQAAAAAARNTTACSACVYAVTVTRYSFPHMDLLVEEQSTANGPFSGPVTNLTEVELTTSATLPPPLPSGLTEGAGLPLADVLAIAAVLGAGIAAIAATLIVLSRSRRRRPGPLAGPPREGPGRGADGRASARRIVSAAHDLRGCRTRSSGSGTATRRSGPRSRSPSSGSPSPSWSWDTSSRARPRRPTCGS